MAAPGDLSRLRFSAAQSRGRRYPEPLHAYRDDFQRDRDRIIHARAFRRLEDKTQVFAAGISDHFRNRLTHTIEVAQISRTLAATLGLNEQLTEALALAHDIGHPPFAHAGEEELDRQMRRFDDRFDHNLHALRIVETFEQSYARFPGLNLTFEVREGIVKHSRDFEPGENASFDEYLPGFRPPLEAQLIDVADEIAYNTADLDDVFSAQFFTSEELAADVPLFGEIAEIVETQFAGATERVKFLEALRAATDLLVTALVEGTILAAREAGVETVEDVRRCPRRLVTFTPGLQELNKQLKGFLRARVYFSQPLTEDRDASAARVAELFGFFIREPERLPAGYLESGEPLHRQVCDYIAGMTDGYFLRIYHQFLG